MTLLCRPAPTPSPHTCLGWRQGNQRFEERLNRPEALRGALETQPQTSQEPAVGLDGFTLKKAECAAGGPGTAESASLVRGAVKAQLDRLEMPC